MRSVRRQSVMVVLPPRTLLLDVAGPLEVLRSANLEPDAAVQFDVQLVAARPQVCSSSGLQLAGLQPLPERVPVESIVLLVGSVQRVQFALPTAPADDAADEAALVAWLRARVTSVHTLVTVCSGALLAARAGLLDGHDCTSHHSLCAELGRLAPRARVLENRLYVEDRRRFTSAGVTAGTDLLLHLVQRLAGAAVAARIARDLVLYLRRDGAEPQLSPWLAGRNHLHAAVHRVQDAVLSAPTRDWHLPELARLAHTSPRHLSRLFNAHVGMHLPDWLNTLRVEVARQLIEQGQLGLEQIAERAGFGSARQLRRAWSRLHSIPPASWRHQSVKHATDPGTLSVAASR